MLKQLLSIFVVLLSCQIARAEIFAKSVDVDPLRVMSMQHNQIVKTFDTYARDVILFITGGKAELSEMTAPQAVLDMTFNPRAYADQNLIYIRNKPFRQEFESLKFIDPAERKRIVEKGTISLSFWLRPDVRTAMDKIVATATVKAKAVNEIGNQALVLSQLIDYPHGRGTFMTQAFLPAEGAKNPNDKPWDTIPNAATHMIEHPETHDQAYYEGIMKIAIQTDALGKAWRAQDVAATNLAAAELSRLAASLNPVAYPSETKRRFELTYNMLSRLTWPGAAIYFVAAVFFLIYFKLEIPWMYVAGWISVLIGFAVHTAAIGIRWWLVEKSVGNWFESIPIKNQFESVMFAAWFGALVALILESGVINTLVKKVGGFEFRKLHGMGIFGLAGAAVGVLALVALFATPYVTKNDIIGGGIKQNAGILMTYWLYIHVTLVTASYALIGMTFVLGVWYCIQYFKNRDAGILQTLDAANLTMLQLAFWVLGIGIITGALWADVSWGRPWAWDPKETFALITWIVYLIIVHIRFVTSGTNRALVTSALSVVGFFVMLFNWIGVNFWLVGLHSYA